MSTQQDRRIRSRFETSVETILFTHNESFKTKSLNLSMSGALLETLVPANFMKRPIEVVFILPNRRRVLIRSLMIGGPRPSARMMFLAFDSETKRQLEWLLKRSAA